MLNGPFTRMQPQINSILFDLLFQKTFYFAVATTASLTLWPDFIAEALRRIVWPNPLDIAMHRSARGLSNAVEVTSFLTMDGGLRNKDDQPNFRPHVYK